MDNEPVANAANESRNTRHNLSDWLSLHELNVETCGRILDTIPHVTGEAVAHRRSNSRFEMRDAEAAWLRVAEAIRRFLPEQKSAIDDTFEHTVKIVDRGAKPRRAFTLDKGPTAYPVISFSYRGEPSDHLIIAHEFGHAVQIRASRGKFVPPIIREVCAFLGEGALVAHALQSDAGEHIFLEGTWKQDNVKYFGKQKNRLRADLLKPDTPYRYAWNYPIARYLALTILDRCSSDWIWSAFEGRKSVRDILQELSLLSN